MNSFVWMTIVVKDGRSNGLHAGAVKTKQGAVKVQRSGSAKWEEVGRRALWMMRSELQQFVRCL